MRLYKLLDEDLKILYIGRTKRNPEERIIEHFNKLKWNQNRYKFTWLKKVRHFSYSTKLDNEADLHIYEIYEIASNDPEHNREVFEDKSSLFLPALTWKTKPIEKIDIPIEKYRTLAEEIDTQLKNDDIVDNLNLGM